MMRDSVERVISWFYYPRNGYKNAIEQEEDPNKALLPASWYKNDFSPCARSGDTLSGITRVNLNAAHFSFVVIMKIVCRHVYRKYAPANKRHDSVFESISTRILLG